MLISNISVDNVAQSFEILRKNISSITASGAHIVLGFDDAWSFETPKINNHNVTAPSLLIVLGDDSAQSFETHPEKSRCHCTK